MLNLIKTLPPPPPSKELLAALTFFDIWVNKNDDKNMIFSHTDGVNFYFCNILTAISQLEGKDKKNRKHTKSGYLSFILLAIKQLMFTVLNKKRKCQCRQ